MVTAATDLHTLGSAAVYAVVIGFVFAECALLVGFFLPGDTLLVGAGLLAADPTRGVSLAWLLGGVTLAAVGGECVGYLVGFRAGEPLLRRRAGRIITPAKLARADEFARRYGVLALIAARWVPWVRTFAPLLAGAARMPWPRFLAGNVAGALCWAPVLLLGGYLANDVPMNSHVSLVVIGVVAVITSAWGVVRWRRQNPRPG